MRGRINNSAHSAAVAAVFEVTPRKDEALFCLNQILESNEFCSSHRCQEFLSYVVTHALEGDFDGIKERILGIRVFGREANYDTNSDSIVRVTASDVRKRLRRYYKTPTSLPIRIELPAGSYIPKFHYTFPDTAPPSAAEIASPDPALETVAYQSIETVSPPSYDTADTQTSSAEPLEPFRSQERHPLMPRLSLRIVAWTALLCLAFLIVGWKSGILHASAAFQQESRANSEYSFYTELLGPIATDAPQHTKIVLSNPLLFLYRGSISPMPPPDVDRGEKKVPIPQRLASNLTGGADDPGIESRYHYLALDTTDYTGLGEAQTAFNLEKLFNRLNRSAQLTEARFLNWNEARDQNLVLLGARHMNPWTQANIANVNFSMDHNAIHNAHSQQGERASYTANFTSGVLEDYGLIWMSQSPSGSRVLVLAGLTSTGTAGVGNFFVDPHQMKPIFVRLKSASPDGLIPANWQALVRITARDDVPINVSLVTLRILNPN